MPNLDDQLGAELEQLRGDGLYRTLRTIASAQGAHVVLDGREFLNFSSNDYLGLANDPILKRAAAVALEEFGVGAGASRLVCGNLRPYEELERKLAAFKDRAAAIVFGSGYAANVGTITALVGEGDVVILDKLDHASIIDGARQSGATIRVYPHKNLKRLEEILVGATSSRDSNRSRMKFAPTGRRFPRVLVVTETVFSMDGDLAPLAEIAELKEKHGAWLMIDEAHATGLYAKNRRGLAEAAGVEGQIDVTLGTLSKALGCAGGFVVGSQTLIDYLRNRARSLIYSTALPPAVVAAAAAAVDFVMSDAGHQRRDKLWRNVSEMKNGLAQLGIENQSRSAIIPIIIGDESAAVELSRKLYDHGIFVPAIRFPTVPKGKARLRVAVTAGHTEADVGELLRAVGAIFNRDRPASGVSTKQLPPHQSALRKGRVSLPDECYFLTTCVEGRQPVLASPEAATIVIDALRWLRDQERIRLLGFVVMPDHVHLSLALRNHWTLPEVMHSWKRHASHVIRSQIVGAVSNRDHDQTPIADAIRSHKNRDRLWQDGYHDHLLRGRRDFEKRLAYMHDNPVRKGLVKSAEEYPFSTAHPKYAGEIDWAWMEGVEP